jgi:hypothetical protein
MVLAILVIEQVGEDGRSARIVELEGEIVAALVGALQPGRLRFRLALTGG